MDRLPIFVKLRDQACLVVGGGTVAERKVRLLARSGARITVQAPHLSAELNRMRQHKDITWVDGEYGTLNLSDFRLVIAATSDETTNQHASEDAEQAGILCNVVDNNELSNFIVPAIVDRSPVVVAIGTEGNAPVLAQRLKSKIEAWLPTRIGALASQAGRWRGLVKRRFAELSQRRRFWQVFFAGPIADHLLAGRQRAAEKLMRSQLVGNADADRPVVGEAWIVGAGPGDPGLLTVRAQQLISLADVVIYDRLVSSQILDFARKDAEFICVGKRAGAAVMSQAEINQLLVDEVREGNRVCRLKGGDPFVFGRGAEEAIALREAGLTFQIVPGISAALGCAAYAGIPLTLRGISGSVTMVSAKLDRDTDPDWPALLNSGHTLAIYMGVGSLRAISEQFQQHAIDPDLPIAMVENGTTNQQRVLHSRAATFAEDARREALQSPAMLFVGESVGKAKQLQWFEPAATTQAAAGRSAQDSIAEPWSVASDTIPELAAG